MERTVLDMYLWCQCICSIALFCSEEKAKLFVPDAEAKRCITVSSATGRLIDIEMDTVKKAIQSFEVPLALAFQ